MTKNELILRVYEQKITICQAVTTTYKTFGCSVVLTKQKSMSKMGFPVVDACLHTLRTAVKSQSWLGR